MFPPELESTKPDSATVFTKGAERLDYRVKLFWIFAFGVIWLPAVLYEFEQVRVAISSVFTVLFGMVLYLDTRPKEQKATSTEQVVATTWRWIRILTGVAAVILFGIVPVAALFLSPVPTRADFWMAIAAGLFIAAMAVWIGRYGWSRSLRRDLKLHAERRQRYRWRF